MEPRGGNDDRIVDDTREAYPAIDEAWKEGWDEPKMADYDDYEQHEAGWLEGVDSGR